MKRINPNGVTTAAQAMDQAQEGLRRLPLIERAWFWIGRQTNLHDGVGVHQPKDFTCLECSREPTCESAWDFYNTDGDCLEMK